MINRQFFSFFGSSSRVRRRHRLNEFNATNTTIQVLTSLFLSVNNSDLWAVVNNAGICLAVGPSDWLTVDDYRATADVNLYGMIDVTMTFLPLIKKSRGRVVNTASLAGRMSMDNVTPYSVSKYGVEAFTDGLR